MTRRDFVKAGLAVALTTAEGSASPNGLQAHASPEGKATEPNLEQVARRDWTAQWIWSSPRGLEANFHVYFRREFTLESLPHVPVHVAVSASTEYMLYVNGLKIGFGPPVSDPKRHYFDIREIRPYLRQGKNVIAAHVYSLATETEDTLKERGLFILEGAINAGGQKIVLDTDSRWRFLVPEVWKRDAPRQSFQLHFTEVADLRKEPRGWNEAQFDDSAWSSALEIGRPPQVGYAGLVQRDLGEIDEEFLPISKVVCLAEVQRAGANPILALQVHAEQFLPISTVKFSRISSLEAGTGDATVETPAEGFDAVIVFDMGKMVMGCPFLKIDGASGAVVDVSISEYLENGRVLAFRRLTRTQNICLTDRVTLRDGLQTWQRGDYNGYRYIQLTFRGARTPLTIRRVGTTFHRYRFAREAAFRSSNPTLDRIFEVSKWSHRVNTHWGYCGSAWREHAQWVDLAWPAMNQVVFNDAPSMRYYLHQAILEQDGEGKMQFPVPGRLSIELPEQTMWLAEALWKSYLYFGDLQMARDILPAMVKANGWFRKHLTPRGLITTGGGWKIWLVIDWGYPFVNNPDPNELATLNLIYYSFLRSIERVAEAVGDISLSHEIRGQADLLKQTINETFFAPEEGRYYERPGRLSASPFASTLAVKYDVAPGRYTQSVSTFSTGSELRPGKASPWFMYDVLEALARAGRYEDAVTAICRYWSTFFEGGGTTFWELWNIPGEDVHPLRGFTKEMMAQTITYSSGPAPYIINHVLGVQPTAAGFEEALIAPHYSALEYAEGSVPTPQGDIRLGWQENRQEKRVEVYLEVPEGVRAVFHLPYSERHPIVRLDNRMLYDSVSFGTDARIQSPRALSDKLELQLAPGYYHFSCTAS